VGEGGKVARGGAGRSKRGIWKAGRGMVVVTKLAEVGGIGETFTAKLEAAGVLSIEQLLQMGGTRKGREELSAKSGVSEKLVLKWVNRADLARIKGIGSEYADLLEAAGVDSVPELAQRNAEHLIAALSEANAARKLTRRLPAADEVADWVEQAKRLPRMVTDWSALLPKPHQPVMVQ